ncbi:AAA family ATPase [Porphyrobacter algicida]|uniref:AAA family ATPase n=1 Tax=Qipengyuania algicida TaxID=1836209 RepID=A0A845AMU7_9SPHN|nr:AAA family ATPase [Qipengyuania algicida]MXP30191.1 AAA family ATPase [Qipengyuania algicida]
MTEESWISKLKRDGYAAADAIKSTYPMEWAVDGFLPAIGTSIWFGAGATGKTQLLLTLAAQIARPLGNEPHKWLEENVNVCGRILVLSAEDLWGDLMRRLGGIVSSLQVDTEIQEEICSRIHIVPFLSMTSAEFDAKNPCLFFRGDTREWEPTRTLKEIEAYIEEWNSTASPRDRIVGVIMDSATTMAGFETTNAEATTNFLFYLNRLCVRQSLFWAIIGHTLKDNKFDPDNPQINAVARLRGSAMWSTTPRSVVEVRLAHEEENLGRIQGIDRRDILIVNVVKANSYQASRTPRYLQRIEGAAFKDITSLAPRISEGGEIVRMYSDEEISRLSAVFDLVSELFDNSARGRVTFRELSKKFEESSANDPFIQMDGNPRHDPGKAPHGGFAWCLHQIQNKNGIHYYRQGFDRGDLASARKILTEGR